MFVLEALIVTFGERLVENARFGSLDCHFWRGSREKFSFWKLGLSLLVKVSWKLLVLEAWSDALGESRCAARVSRKSVTQECQERVSSQRVQQG